MIHDEIKITEQQKIEFKIDLYAIVENFLKVEENNNNNIGKKSGTKAKSGRIDWNIVLKLILKFSLLDYVFVDN